MKIWVDADACPVVIKEILFRAAARTGVQLTLVANKYLRVPRSDNIAMIAVEAGLDIENPEGVKFSKQLIAAVNDGQVSRKSVVRWPACLPTV